LTESPPPTSPERRLPLRQLPSERSFSASPQKSDLVSNDRVFLLLNRRSAFIGLLSAFIRATEICHFGSDGFCLFASKFR
jgi:hypothetical protein